MHVDLLIVGQGLGGSVLACEALYRGLSVAVIDNGWKTAASTVAAGMWNPISFRKVIPVWRDEACMAALEEAYPRYEKMLNTSFFHPMPIARVFPNEEYAKLWQKQLAEGMNWISLAEETFSDPIHAPFGHGLVKKAGYIDMPVLLEAVKEKLQSMGALVTADFEENQLQHEERTYKYQHLTANKVVLATGLEGRFLKAMEGLPLQINKGEVLEVEIANFRQDLVLNNEKWVQPRGQGRYRLGATYDWKDTSLDLLQASKEQILTKVEKMLKVSVKVVDHLAGQRPTVRDRRPLLGRLDGNHLYSFNGLGTRGVLIAPLLAQELFAFMEGKADLHPEANITRLRKTS